MIVNEKISSYIQGIRALPYTKTNFENAYGESTPLRIKEEIIESWK